MSVSKWAYAPEKCDGKPCVGDCDMCSRAEDEVSIPSTDVLEYMGDETAKPIGECAYPNCEECDKYHGHYCTVPMVISKEIWHLAKEFISETESRLTLLESLVADLTIGKK